MSANPQGRYRSIFQSWSKITSLVTLLVGSVVLIGWWFNLPSLQSIVPGWATMKVNTALAFLAAGLALWLLQTQSTTQWRLFFRRACAVLIITLGLFTLAEYVFHWQLGIDELFVKESFVVGAIYPGRMAPVTALNFLLLGSAFLTIDVFRRYRMAQLITLTAALFALLALIGYLYSVESLYRIASYASIALHTALTFLILCLGLLFVRPDQGWMTILTSESAGGVLARRLLPAAVIVPILLGWLRLLGQLAGLYDTVFGLALFAIANIVTFTFLIAWSAASLYGIDSARQQAQDDLHRLNTELDSRVLERTAQLAGVNQQLQSEVAVREQAEAKFRALLEAAPDAIVITNQQGLIVLVNSQLENLFGYAREALFGQSIDLLVPERFRGGHAAHRADYFALPRVRAMGTGLELYGLRQDGTEFPVEISLSPVEAAEGLLVAAAIRDTTLRKQIEADLRQSQERFVILFRNSPAGIALIRQADEHYLDVNESFLRMFGYERDEVLGHNALELGLLSVAARENIVLQIQERGSMRDLEISFRTKSGDLRLVLSSVEQVVVAGEVCLLTILYDITERQRAEQESQRLKTVLDKMAEGAQLIGFDWRYIYLNDAAAGQGLRPKHELLGHTMQEMYPGIDQTPLFQIMRRGLEEKVSDHIENQFTFADNSTGWFDLSIQPMPEGIFILSTDISARRQVAVAMRESEERFAKAFRSSPAALTITRQSDGLFIDVNENFLEVFGYTRAEVVGRRSSELSININPPEETELSRQLTEEGSIRNYEIVLQTKSGEHRNMLFSSDKLELNGETHVLTTLFDVTNRKRAEAALRESEERFQLVAWATRDAIWDWDLKTDTIWWSDGLQKLFFYKPEDVKPGADWRAEHIHPEDRDKVLKSIQEILARSDEFWSKEYRYRRASGAYADVFDRAYILYDEQHQPKRMIGAMIDITERKQTEAALAQERDLLQALMDNIPDTIYFKDMASRFTRINWAQARVLGLEETRDAIGKTDADFQAPHLAAEFLAEEEKLLQTGQAVIDREEFNPTLAGQPRWFSTTKVPMFDRHGHVNGLIGMSHDITERIKAEEALQQANAQLTDRVSQLSLLSELEEQLQVCFAVEEIYEVTAKLAGQLFQAEVGTLYVINNSRNWLEAASVWGAAAPKSEAFGLADCWALRRGHTHLSGTAYNNVTCRHLNGLQPAYSICIPILAQGETLGVLHLRAAPDSTAHWDEAKQQSARVVADSVALALANLKLRETLRQQSIRDPLTDLYNRRYMEESLERELHRAARTQRPVGVIMLDVDHFKKVNDSHGHDTGDAVLRQLGRFLKERTRGGDIACRYGGEEFVLILPEATLEQTRLRAEQHRQDFKALPVQHAGHTIGAVTLSLGVAVYPDHGKTGDDLLRAADAALYRAKHEGRDQVTVAG